MLVDHTGGGKYLVLCIATAAMGAGITLAIVPLLTLTISQLSKLNTAVQSSGTVNTVHLDETSGPELTHKSIPKMESI